MLLHLSLMLWVLSVSFQSPIWDRDLATAPDFSVSKHLPVSQGHLLTCYSFQIVVVSSS